MIITWTPDTRTRINMEEIIPLTLVNMDGQDYYACNDMVNQQTVHIPADVSIVGESGMTMRDHVEFFGLIK